MVHVHNGILLGHKKERNDAIYSNMDIETGILGEVRQKKTTAI